MLDDVALAPFLSCGGYTDSLTSALVWMSSGGTKSVVHYDASTHAIPTIPHFHIFHNPHNPHNPLGIATFPGQNLSILTHQSFQGHLCDRISCSFVYS